jgi:hypothetical protein
MLSRAALEAAITAGHSVLLAGVLYRTLEDLPSDERLAELAAAKETAPPSRQLRGQS